MFLPQHSAASRFLGRALVSKFDDAAGIGVRSNELQSAHREIRSRKHRQPIAEQRRNEGDRLNIDEIQILKGLRHATPTHQPDIPGVAFADRRHEIAQMTGERNDRFRRRVEGACVTT